MSSLRRVQSSKANGALSKGPTTPAGKLRSSENAIIHGLCANCIVLEDEERENFLNLLHQHVEHFRPADEVEFGLVEEMCAARWRQRRAWSMETRMFDNQTARPPDGDSLDRMVAAFDFMAAAPSLSLLQRYETRLNLTYQRSLRTLIMLRTVKPPNEPSPISEHPPETIAPTAPAVEQPPPAPPVADSEALGSACFSLHQSPYGVSRPPGAAALTAGYAQSPHQNRAPHSAAAASGASHVPAEPPAAHPAMPPRAKESGGAA
jgi:hypothetical protein